MTSIARKEILAGDEITEYYGDFLSTQADWINNLMLKFIPERKALEDKI
jgi:hypothetical protein